MRATSLVSENIEYEEMCKEIRRLSSRIVFTNGCFDLLHPGHISVLSKCREIAGPRGCVVVGINSDDSVKKLKGVDRPIIDENSRAIMVLSTRYADHVIVFSEDTPLELLNALKPDVIVKGSDYKGKEIVGQSSSAVVFADTVNGLSTSSIIERIKRL